MRYAYTLTPAALLAAGGFASQAGAALIYDPDGSAGDGIVASSTLFDVDIGGTGQVQYQFGLKDLGGPPPDPYAALFTNESTSYVDYDGPSANGDLPDGSENFKNEVGPLNGFSVRNQTGSDTYYRLKFDIGGSTYLGTATIGSATADGRGGFNNDETLRQIAYDLAPASALPEPATWASMVAGFGVIGGAARAARRRRQPKAA